MNAGLSNLAALKSWLLPTGMIAGTDYDDQIAAIGKGVASTMERYCNRKLARVVGDVFEISADRAHVSLPRFPLEQVTKVELRTNFEDGWVEQADAIFNQSVESGLIFFGFIFGGSLDRLRVTYDGGFFFETLEPDDGEFPTALPDGATVIPDDLLLAFRLQCEVVWKAHDRLGLAVAEKSSSTGAQLPVLDLSEEVKRILNGYVRF